MKETQKGRKELVYMLSLKKTDESLSCPLWDRHVAETTRRCPVHSGSWALPSSHPRSGTRYGRKTSLDPPDQPICQM